MMKASRQLKQPVSLLGHLLASAALATALVGQIGPAVAQELNAELGEQIVTVPKKVLIGSVDLETTLYKPAGDGPFPLVVINHGKAMGDSRFQGRMRHARAARFFMQRGYAVIMPMRQGFSKSGGAYIGGGCNVESNGHVQAEDVKAALDWAVSQAWADKSNILVMGQSHGGWTTLAFGTLGYPGVKGLVNFAGGLKQETCGGWEANLGRAAGRYGAESKLPSLWFYGDNDSYFSVKTYKGMHEHYTASGGKVELVEFGTFGNDAHAMFGVIAGERIWQTKVQEFMQKVGLPTQVIQPKYASVQPMAVPPRSGFAPLAEVEKVPHLNAGGKEGYKNFLTKQLPRAFALAPNGAWQWAEMGDDPAKRALDACNRRTNNACKLYAVDDDVVWTP
jgi:dienelactone hydrolase